MLLHTSYSLSPPSRLRQDCALHTEDHSTAEFPSVASKLRNTCHSFDGIDRKRCVRDDRSTVRQPNHENAYR